MLGKDGEVRKTTENDGKRRKMTENNGKRRKSPEIDGNRWKSTEISPRKGRGGLGKCWGSLWKCGRRRKTTEMTENDGKRRKTAEIDRNRRKTTEIGPGKGRGGLGKCWGSLGKCGRRRKTTEMTENDGKRRKTAEIDRNRRKTTEIGPGKGRGGLGKCWGSLGKTTEDNRNDGKWLGKPRI